MHGKSIAMAFFFGGWIAIALLECTSRPRDKALLRGLVEALGSRRAVEPRSTGGFAYAPCLLAPPLPENEPGGRRKSAVRY
jgi:hypothetical protein